MKAVVPEPAGGHCRQLIATTAPSSRASVRSSLTRAARAVVGHEHAGPDFPWHRANPATLLQVRGRLVDGVDSGRWRPATVNASIAAIRAVLKRAWIAGDLGRDEYERRCAALRKVPGRSAPGRALAPADIGRLFRACASDRNRAAGARDAALLGLLFGCGLRRAEAAAVQMDDIGEGTVVVHGKGRRERHAFIHNGAVDAVEAWIRFRGTDPGPLFAPVSKSGAVAAGRGMSGQAIAARVNLRAEQAGLGRVSPHVLRRSYCTQLLRNGHDLAIVGRLMGHAQVSTTALYDRRSDDDAQAAAATLAVPFLRVAPGSD